tara:strand:- start:2844 stop:3344 length:501 start_codon:yes stop_codon:yes gene_type:complete
MKFISNIGIFIVSLNIFTGEASGFITKYNNKPSMRALYMNSDFMPFDVPIAVAAATTDNSPHPLPLAPVPPPPHLLPKIPMCNEVQDNFGEKIVLQISSALPQFDTVGHKILSANHDFIEYILNDTIFDHDTKKMIILTTIKLAQMGDDFGSSILQQYYNIVDSCL